LHGVLADLINKYVTFGVGLQAIDGVVHAHRALAHQHRAGPTTEFKGGDRIGARVAGVGCGLRNG